MKPDTLGPDHTLDEWLAALATPSAVPAGGSAAAIAGAMAAALTQMVAGMTHVREKYLEVHAEAADVSARAHQLCGRLAALATRDAEVFTSFTAALALPSGSTAEKTEREAAKARAFMAGAGVQLQLLEGLVEAADLAEAMAARGLAGALGDAATGVFLAAGAARSAYWAVRSNLRAAGDAAEGDLSKAKTMLGRVEAAERRVVRLLDERVR
jgi:formiminotetrahydrofolate cyclodeaminase